MDDCDVELMDVSRPASSSTMSDQSFTDIERLAFLHSEVCAAASAGSWSGQKDVICGMDDLLMAERFYRLLSMPKPTRHVQEMHSWNPDDRSLNIFVIEKDKLTFHRYPVANTTDCIRGKVGFSQGFHVWQIEWPKNQRGSHAYVGVATKNAPLYIPEYKELLGMNAESYAWDLNGKECIHDFNRKWPWDYPEKNNFKVPDKFYCILDMDKGHLAFATDDEYLGVAFRNLKGRILYPIVSTVWGCCEVTMKYMGSLEQMDSSNESTSKLSFDQKVAAYQERKYNYHQKVQQRHEKTLALWREGLLNAQYNERLNDEPVRRQLTTSRVHPCGVGKREENYNSGHYDAEASKKLLEEANEKRRLEEEKKQLEEDGWEVDIEEEIKKMNI